MNLLDILFLTLIIFWLVGFLLSLLVVFSSRGKNDN